jgi:tight adherence protein C
VLSQFQKPLALDTIWIILATLVIGIVLPDIWLKIRRSIRKKLVVKDLPDVIDLLSLCVNAGLDFSLAVNWVVEKSKRTPLVEELELFLLETRMGKSRRRALQDMSKRFNLPEVSSFTRALIQAERLGTPVESALNILSEEMRDFRFRRGEQLALQAPIKMLFPLIFCIMPVVAIIVAGPIFLQFMGGGIQLFK